MVESRSLNGPLLFHVVPLCPGEMGLFCSKAWRSSSEVVLAMQEPRKPDPRFPPLPPALHGDMPAWKKKKHVHRYGINYCSVSGLLTVTVAFLITPRHAPHRYCTLTVHKWCKDSDDDAASISVATDLGKKEEEAFGHPNKCRNEIRARLHFVTHGGDQRME